LPALVGEQIDTRSAAGRLVLNVLASVSQGTDFPVTPELKVAPFLSLAIGRYSKVSAPTMRSS
jgi:hypothetical protein